MSEEKFGGNSGAFDWLFRKLKRREDRIKEGKSDAEDQVEEVKIAHFGEKGKRK